MPNFMSSPPWLKPFIAHRGLHNASQGVIENTPSAVTAAIAAGYAIEVDLQEAGDGEPMVFHDAALERLTSGKGLLKSFSAAALQAIPFKDTADRMLTLRELLGLVDGQASLFLEIKSDWARAGRFAERIAAGLRGYAGFAAVMSFDPCAVAPFRRLAPHIPRGIVMGRVTAPVRSGSASLRFSAVRRFLLNHMLYTPMARPQFIAYDITGLPAAGPWLARRFGMPLLTWTVRTPDERRRAQLYADATIFEGFRP